MPELLFNDDPHGYGGHWSTKDITVAAIVASFGFRWRGKAPIMHLVHANRLVSLIDKGTGRIEDTQTVGYFFDYATDHPTHGTITCGMIDVCYAKREMDSKLAAGGYITPDKIKALNALLSQHPASATLAREVCQMADAMENLLLIATGVLELANDPLIQVTKALRKGRLDLLRPMETEPLAQRLMERFAARNS